MVSNEEEREIEKFIRPIRCLYSDYAMTIDRFKDEHGVLLNNYELEDLGDDVEYKLYAEFSKDGDGELARELVQTWICDNRLEITNCICIALNNRKQAFCNWFHDSEQYTSPDKLLLYCLGRQNRLHVSIFNSKYVWSTLANHIRYDYFEILEHSQIILVFLGERHYAIFRKKGNPVHDESSSKSNKTSRSRGRGRRCGSNTRTTTKKKTVCRSSNKKSQSVSPVGKRSQTLKSARKECFGIGSKSLAEVDVEKYGRGKQRKGQTIDYLKLNEGEEDLDSTPVSPKKIKHVPVRSGPMPHRQSARAVALWLLASFVLSLISTVCELFFTKKVPCFTLQDIIISGEVSVLAFLSDPSNLWLDIFCSRYGFFSFVLSLISTVCELFFTKKVHCFTLQDIIISGEVLVLAFLSDPSNLWLDIFCSRYGFFSFVLSLISTVCELFFTKKVPCFTLQDIFISGEVLVLAFLSDPSNLWYMAFFSFVLSLISTVCELFFTKEVPCFTLQDIFISGEVLVN